MAEGEKAALSETRGLARLKGELAAAEKGSEAYNSIKKKITDGYGKYHAGLAEEIGKVGLLDATYQKLTASVRASHAARQYEKFAAAETGRLDETMASNLKKLQEGLEKGLGAEKGSEIYAKLYGAIMEGAVAATAEVTNFGRDYRATGLPPDVQKALDAARANGPNQYKAIWKIAEAQRLYADTDRKARERGAHYFSLSRGRYAQIYTAVITRCT